MCGSCNVTYYGKTEGHFNVRPGENLGLSLSTGNMVACKPSAISDHLLLHEHTDSSFTTFKTSLRESVLTKGDSPELNRNVTLMSLLLFN